MHRTLLALAALVFWSAATLSAVLVAQGAGQNRVEGAQLARIDDLVNAAIAARQTPGAVVAVGQGDRTLYEKAFGARAMVPAMEPMSIDTVFDVASLTKVVATTTAVMTLIEDGRLRLNDPVASHIPGFERYGKGNITIRHLLTHVSGLRPDVDLHPWTGYETAIELAKDEVPTAAPNETFVYSDINFFLLGHIVSRVSGESLDAYLKRVVFDPLGMKETGFNPPQSLLARIAPTERCAGPDPGTPCKRPDAPPLRGIVHDPTARRMGGVAGHAGLFSTARDLQRFVRMLINGGQLDGVRVLSAASVRAMTSPQTPAGMRTVRGFGWDIDTQFSSNRGDLFPVGSFGHTGFTGTSIWVDPASGGWVIFLSNRVHPDATGDVTPLRGRIATVAAAAISGAATRSAVAPGAPIQLSGAKADTSGRVLTGIDVLVRDNFKPLRGKRVGLITNHTGKSRDGAATIDLLHKAPGVTLVSLFSPEHGIRGVLDADVPAEKDEKTGLPIHSLFYKGGTGRPLEGSLDGIDTLVIDLQDIGARFYTYQLAMGYAMEEAAKKQIAVVVLDRPNPINGWQIEGPLSRVPGQGESANTFIAYLPMPIRHGMTMGELARLYNEQNKINVDLTVIAMENWSREQWFDETGLAWINPSPNMRNMNQATLYPGIGAIEYSNISVGRGTDQPFEQIGAPWINGRQLAERLNARRIPGIRFYPVTFTPASSKYAKEECQGVFMMVTNRAALPAVRVGVEIASALFALYGNKYEPNNMWRLLGSEAIVARIAQGEDPAAIASSASADEARWRQLRAKYLLYR
ncbi:MAG TPA: serine hydrolase [Vicinamibacterales bacterium]|nr:serine hydrolase [Vicinamibacterales bacterium]